jgi:hypothetical protein
MWSEAEGAPGAPSRVRWPLPHWLVLGLLFATALGIRLYHSNDPPLNFHATRQYRSLIIARGFYYDHLAAVPEWKHRVASCSQRNQGVLEPPIMEFLVAAGYRVLGGERLWLPRLLSTLFWLTGGVFLYLIGRRVASEDAALFGLGFYLFLPFAVVASRSFQPDPLMVMLMLAGVWAILRYDERPTTPRLAGAAVLASAAFLVKPGGVFVLLAAFLAMVAGRRGIRALWSRPVLLFLVITLLPTLIVYGYGLVSGTFLVQEAQKTVLPRLWVSPFFWRGWLHQIGGTVGFVCFIGALLGTASVRPGGPRTLMASLWAGYIAFGLALNYNLATHDYYQLQLVPVVALSTGPVMALVVNEANQRRRSLGWCLASSAVVLLAWVLSIAMSKARLASPDLAREVRSREEIGEKVNHSTRTIFLSGDYGVPLEYHGLLSGAAWPLASDLEWERLAGQPPLSPEERFRAWFSQKSPEYFIVEDRLEFEHQPDLKRFLTERYPIIAQSDDYLIFTLKDR